MKTNHKPALAVLNRWKFKGWIVCGWRFSARGSMAKGNPLAAMKITGGEVSQHQLITP